MSIVLAAAIFAFGPDQRPRIDDTALDRHILDNVGAGKTGNHYR
jgi:hypothetical protein